MVQELGRDRQVGVFPLSDRFVEMGGIPRCRRQLHLGAKRTMAELCAEMEGGITASDFRSLRLWAIHGLL